MYNLHDLVCFFAYEIKYSLRLLPYLRLPFLRVLPYLAQCMLCEPTKDTNPNIYIHGISINKELAQHLVFAHSTTRD